MNKIYKVVWSKVKNCYVVVSEVAKANGKSGVKTVAAVAAAAVLMSGGTALAADRVINTGVAADPITDMFENLTASTGGAINNSGTLVVEKSEFNNNKATSSGGAIYNTGTLTVTESEFTGNTTAMASGRPYGGAISNVGGTLTVEDSTFTNNGASGSKSAYGSVVYTSNGTTTISGSTFDSNAGGGSNGMIYATAGSELTLADNTYTNNGRAIVNAAAGAKVTFEGTNTFEGNTTNDVLIRGDVTFAEGSKTVFDGDSTGADIGIYDTGKVVIQEGSIVSVGNGIIGMEGSHMTINGGTLEVGADSTLDNLDGTNATIKFLDNVNLDIANNNAEDLSFTVADTVTDASMKVDGLANGQDLDLKGIDLTIETDGHAFYNQDNNIKSDSDVTINAGKTGYKLYGDQTVEADNVTINAGDDGIFSADDGNPNDVGNLNVKATGNVDVIAEDGYAIANQSKNNGVVDITGKEVTLISKDRGAVKSGHTAGTESNGTTNISGDKVTIEGATRTDAPRYSGVIYAQSGEVNVDSDDITIKDTTGEGYAVLVEEKGDVAIGNENAKVTVDGDIKAESGTLDLAAGADSEITGAINTGGNKDANVSLNDGAKWNVTDTSKVSNLAGNKATIAVEKAQKELVTIENNKNKDLSLDVANGGDLGVDIKEGLQELKYTVVDGEGNALIKDLDVDDVYLKATVDETNGKVTTTIKPGDEFVIESDVTAGKVTADSLVVEKGGFTVDEAGNTTIKGKATIKDGLGVAGHAQFYNNVTMKENLSANTATFYGEVNMKENLNATSATFWQDVTMKKGMSAGNGNFRVAENGKVTAENGIVMGSENGEGTFKVGEVDGNTMMYVFEDGELLYGVNAATGDIMTAGGLAVGGGVTVDGGLSVADGISVADGKVDLSKDGVVTAAKVKATNGMSIATEEGKGKITVSEVGGNTMLYSYDSEKGLLFGVNAATGDISTQGGIEVGGGVTVDGGLSAAGGQFEVDEETGNTKVGGALSVADGAFDVAENGKVTATNGMKVQTSGAGSFSFGNIGGNSLFYAMSTADGATNPTIVMNAQNGNIETQGSLSVGNGAFVSDAASGSASVKGSLDVGTDINAAGGIDAGTDVVAQDKYSLVETAQQADANSESIAQNADNIKVNADNIAANADAIAGNKALIDQNTADIQANRDAIQSVQEQANANSDAIAENKAAIAENAGKIQANTDLINQEIANREAADAALQAGLDKEAADRIAADNALNDAIENAVSDLSATQQQVAGNTQAIADNAQAITDEAAARTEADNKLQQAINKETVDRQIEVAKERADRAAEDAKLQSQISTNADNIATNANNIAANTTAINDNRNAIAGLGNRLSSLDNRVDKVGAGAAALAALHPLDYDAENKLSFAAGVGNYAGATAAAVGAFYRPNEDVMFSIGGTAGNGENMVNAGVSFAIGKGSSGVAAMSKAELVDKVQQMEEKYDAVEAENKDLRHEINKLKAMVMELAAKK